MPKKNKEILFEDVDTSSIILAIKKRKPVIVNYVADKNDTKTGSGWRVIQPVAYGLSKSGNPVIRAYQPFGDTKTKVPHWKLFRTDRFETWKTINKPTNIPKPPLAEYNPDGDKSMSQVFVNADFAGAERHYNDSGLERFNQQRHAEKVAQNPYYDLQKNIERSKRIPTPDYVLRNVSNWQNARNNQMANWMNGASAEEMSRTTDFGNNNYIETDSPIRKGDTETAPVQTQQTQNTNITNNKAYNNIALNGPVRKGAEELKQDTEEENNQNNENNKDNESSSSRIRNK